MLTAVQHNEQAVMTPAYPAQSAEYARPCDAVTIATPDNNRPGIEDAIIIRGSNQLTNEEAADEVSTISGLKPHKHLIFSTPVI